MYSRNAICSIQRYSSYAKPGFLCSVLTPVCVVYVVYNVLWVNNKPAACNKTKFFGADWLPNSNNDETVLNLLNKKEKQSRRSRKAMTHINHIFPFNCHVCVSLFQLAMQYFYALNICTLFSVHQHCHRQLEYTVLGICKTQKNSLALRL